MSDITIRDVESFGKVLRRLGQFFETNPELLLEFISSSKIREVQEPSSTEGSRFPELDNIPIFELGKTKSREELLKFLSQYNVDQLRYLIRRFRLGALKSKSSQALAEHLVDQIAKRSVDVFKSHD